MKNRKPQPTIVKLASLAPDPKNPRTITKDAAAGLATSLETFGDLGMVFNDRTGQWVSGHQRLAALKAAGATELVRAGDQGIITHPKTGERFPVRFVDWSESKQRKANLAANNPHIAGAFTDAAAEQLRQLQGEVDFGALQFGNLLEQLEGATKQLSGADLGEAGDQSGELRESFQIVVTCVDEAQQSTLLERFAKEGLKCRALI